MTHRKHTIKTITGLTFFSLSGIHLLNRTILTKAGEKNLSSSRDGSWYQSSQGRIYYQVSGSGFEPLLLIHDAKAFSSSYEWSKVRSLLEEDYTIYTLDLLGSGQSDKPALTYTNYLYVQIITGFIRDVIGAPVTVLATGISSSFLFTSALMDSSLLKKIVAINPMSLKQLARTPSKRSEIIQTLIALPIIGTCIYNFLTSKKNMEYLLNEEYYYNPFLVKKRDVDTYYQAAHAGNGKGKYLRASLDGRYLYFNICRAVRLITVPTIILYGDQLPHAREIALGYRKCNSSIQVRPIARTKMLPQLEAPELFVQTMKA